MKIAALCSIDCGRIGAAQAPAHQSHLYYIAQRNRLNILCRCVGPVLVIPHGMNCVQSTMGQVKFIADVCTGFCLTALFCLPTMIADFY